MRVLVVSWEHPPVVEGGLARHVGKLAEHLARAGVEVRVLTRGARGVPAEEERAGVRVHRVRAARPPADLDAFLAWVGRLNADLAARGGRLLAADGPFDVVHGHDWLVAEAAHALAARAGAPYLTTVHATEHGRHRGWVGEHPQSHVHGVETWMVGAADHVVACSRSTREHLLAVHGVPERRVTVIPNGIDPAGPAPAGDLDGLRAGLAAPGEPLVLLVGRLVYEKGFQVALDALPALSRRLGARFALAGAGPHEPALRAQARRLGLDARGAFLGWVGDDALRALYRVADVCVVPSLYEPFGLVALEAMAAGCPCVVADVGGLREVVPDREARFRPGSPRSLAHRVTRVLTEPELRERLVARGAAHVSRFDWADVARRTAGLYAELAGGA